VERTERRQKQEGKEFIRDGKTLSFLKRVKRSDWVDNQLPPKENSSFNPSPNPSTPVLFQAPGLENKGLVIQVLAGDKTRGDFFSQVVPF